MTKTLTSWIISALLLVSAGLRAQNWDHYTPIAFEGEIPPEFLQRSAEKYEAQKQTLGTTGTQRQRRDKDDFLLQSTYTIDDLLLSGTVLFNDPISAYLNQIKDYLLRDDAENRDKIKVYAVRTPMVNAFTTNDGVVLFHMGLLSRMQNEAQIAFVLCHEFQHFIHQDPLEGYVVTQEVMKDVNQFDRHAYERALLRRNMFSREQEMRADTKGMELFLKSAYSLDDIAGVFDILQYAYLPYEQVPFDPQWLTSGPTVIPAHCLVAEVNPIDTSYVFDSTRSTHPSIPQRRAALDEVMKANPGKGGVAMLLGEERFEKLVKIARFEVAQLYLENHQYEEALYQCYLLQQEHPSSYFLHKTAAWALYGISKYKNAKEFYSIALDEEDMEGEMHQLVNIMAELENHEVNLIAIRKAWEVYQMDRDDREMTLLLEDLLEDWWRVHKGKADKMVHSSPPEGFFDAPRNRMAAVGDGTASLQAQEDSKARSARARATQEGKRGTARAVPTEFVNEEGNSPAVEYALEEDTINYFRYALSDLMAKEEFKTFYEKDMDSKWEENTLTYDERQAWERELRKGKNLGLSKVVFVDPSYHKIDRRKRVSTDYLGEEERVKTIHSDLENGAIASGLKADILSEETLAKKGTDGFNDLVTLRDWLHERFSHDEVDMVNLHADEVLALKEKYGTPNFSWVGGVSITKSKNPYTKMLCCCSTTMFPFALPLTLVYVLTPEHDVLYYTYTVDVEQDKRIGTTWNTYKVKDGDGFWAKRTAKTTKQMKEK